MPTGCGLVEKWQTDDDSRGHIQIWQIYRLVIRSNIICDTGPGIF